MLRWLRSLFYQANRFNIPELRCPLPHCRIRPYRDVDFDSCAEIYKANEGTHFPTGFFERFAASHTNEDFRPLVLVAESEGEIRAFGGITIQRGHRIHRLANLSYGMVHPNHQRLGFGTAVLLARLAALPEPFSDWIVVLSTAGPSASFYERFGFRHSMRYEDSGGTELDLYMASLNRNGWTQCFKALWNSKVGVDRTGITVPVREIRGL